MVLRVVVALCVATQVAAAEPDELVGLGTPCVIAPAGPERFTQLPGPVSNVLFLNRCAGGCTIIGADRDDARNMQSFIPPPGPHPFTEFGGRDGIVGNADDDDEWTKILSCVREVYSYYNVQVTDQVPPTGTFHMAMVSGEPEQIGLPPLTLGISPFACGGADNAISFAFVKEHASISSDDFVKRVCWTITHEAGHAFTLEHTYHWIDDDAPGCDDVMSYDDRSCHPLRYFRGRASNCGGFSEEPCRCGSVQNPHQKLLALFGAGVPTVPPGTAAITTPVANAMTGSVVIAAAGSRRGLGRVELFINGNRWLSQPGEDIGLLGQPDPATYVFALPRHLPDGIVDLVVRGHDDLGAVVESPMITATRGAPCESAETCLEGQTCDAGRCLWAVTGEQGDACTANEFCSTGLCAGEGGKICTQTCVAADTTTCPEGYVCSETSEGSGVCLPPESGCCSAGTSQTPWLHGLAMFGFWALVIRRRRRRERGEP
ncbi:MAG TPA: hypothetical protein VIU61_03345 [Kofleriaceae bacterium]